MNELINESDYTEKQLHFIRRWKKQRTRKWRFIMIYGCLFYGLFMGSLMFFFGSNAFANNHSPLLSYGLTVLLWMVFGFPMGWFLYVSKEKYYKYLKTS